MTRRAARRSLVSALRVLAAAGACVLAGCDAGDPGGPTPVACPERCSCTDGGACEFRCGAGGCLLAECLGSTCTAACPAGGCNLDCDLMGTCTYDCAGGGCTSDCDQGARCDVTCPGGDCTLLCDEGSVCALDCTGAAVPCKVLCEADGQATCTGACESPGCGP